MLRPIPKQILTDSVAVYVPTAVDTYQAPTSVSEYALANVHLQASNVLDVSGTTAKVVRLTTMFVDAVYSTPKLDWLQLQNDAEALGTTVSVVSKGKTLKVASVDAVPDDTGDIHHYEVLLK